MKTFEKSIAIKAPLARVWQAFVDPAVITQWGGGPAKMSARKAKFSLWGGDIYGSNTSVKPTKLLAQDWYSGDWPSPSKLTFSFRAKGDETVIELKQWDIPDAELDDIAKGWQVYYLGPIKELLEEK